MRCLSIFVLSFKIKTQVSAIVYAKGEVIWENVTL